MSGYKPTWTTKDSGERMEFESGMRRDINQGKARYDLIIPENCPNHMLKRWAELLERGAKKYSERNWEKASSEEELARFKESAFRHFIQWFSGEVDEDHAAAVFFNIQGAEYVKEALLKGIKLMGDK
jgi:hypothetical protein